MRKIKILKTIKKEQPPILSTETIKESSDQNSVTILLGYRIYDQLRKLKLCNDLRKEYETRRNVKYDLIMKTRFDLLHLNSPDWKMCLDDKLHCGYGATFGYPEDTLCIATPYVMDKYLSRFELLPEMPLCAHGSIRYIVEKYNLTIGEPSVNVILVRNENIINYYQYPQCRANYEWLYNNLSTLNNVRDIEHHKRFLLKEYKPFF